MTVHLDTPAAQPVAKRSSGRMKGILAIAAGTALLLGGAGTYAYWSTSTTLTASDVASGDLNLTLGAGTWSLDGVLTAPAAVPAAELTAVRVVPGDVLTLTQPLTVTLIGDTIEADLSATIDSAIPLALQPYVTVTFTTTGFGTSTGVNTYHVTPDAEGDPITGSATVTITFSGTTPDREGVTTPINLNNVAFNLVQSSTPVV